MIQYPKYSVVINIPHGSRMHNIQRECSMHKDQVIYQPDPVTTTGEKLFQSDNKISDNRLKRTWKSERQEHQMRYLVKMKIHV